MEPNQAYQRPSKISRLSEDDDDDDENENNQEEDRQAGTNQTRTVTRSTLPLFLISRIISFNVESTSQLAQLRGVCRMFHQSLLGHTTAGSCSKHFIQCPATNENVVSDFTSALLLRRPYVFDQGDLFRTIYTTEWDILDGGCTIEKLRIVSFIEPSNITTEPNNRPAFTVTTPLSIPKVFEACDTLGAIQSFDQLQTVAELITLNGLTRPIAPADPASLSNEEYDNVFVAFVTLSIKPEVAQQKIQSFQDRQWLLLETKLPSEPQYVLFPRRPNCSYVAPVISQDDEKWTAVVLVELKMDAYDYEMREGCHIDSLRLESSWHDAQNNTSLVEGIAIVDDVFSGRESLCAKIDAVARLQEETSNVDFHPNTNNIVRNIVHPALFCYVENITTLQRNMAEALPPCSFSTEEPPLEMEDGKDFWSRPYESSVFQWLPTYFSIANDGSCTIHDYLNNLVPRDNSVHMALYKDLEILFQSCFPFIESVYSYVRAIRPLIRGEEEMPDFHATSLPPSLNVRYCSLRGQNLQVITKIVDYELVHEQIHTGVWHVEGMSHEEIVLTALYIADRDEDFHGADIEFKRSYLRPEAQYLFNNMPQDRPQAVDDMVAEGLIPLGKVATVKGRLIVFPNSHVHKVTDMSFLPTCDQRQSAKRRIVVFFLVNPFRRIVSTREVAPQQISCGGTMSLDDALAYRLQLMDERRHTKQDWNVREIELCEH